MSRGLDATTLLAVTAFALMTNWPSSTGAEEFPPTSGTLIGSRDGDLLDFDCTPAGPDKITCDFVQVLLTNKSNDTKLKESLDSIPQLLTELESENTCAVFDARVAILDGETPEDSAISQEAHRMIEAETKLSLEGSPQQIERMNQFYDAISKLCSEKNEASAREFLLLTHELSAEICEPFFNRYTQIFVRVDENLWVVEGSPSGSCGIVNTSRLYGDPKYPFLWNYEASKIVTNKNGKGIVPCSGLDESPQIYAWDQSPVYKNCKFLE